MISEYKRYRHKKVIFIAACIALSVVCFGLELSMGKFRVGFIESFRIISDHIKGVVPTGFDAVKDMVVWDMYLPRAIAGVAVGAGLGVCGAAMQSSLRNPLADPYTTGISSGASLGAAVAIISGISIIPFVSGEYAIIANAFLFSLIPAAVIVIVSAVRRTSPTSMILIGVAVMYIFSATTSLLMLYADPDSLSQVYIWSVGSIGSARWGNVAYMVVAAAIGVTIFTLFARRMNLLSLKDESVTSLGVDSKRTRMIVLLVVSLTTATLVSFTGTIGFVGLIAPHMVRIFIGSDNRYLIPASAAFGAFMLLAADCVAKVTGPAGLPVGVITALIGGPLFLLLVVRQKRSAWG